MISEEEKKAIKYLEFLSNEKCNCKVCQNAKKHYRIILNLIEKQQKEIEELKKPKANIQVVYGGRCYEKTLKAKDLIIKEYISKDKIRKTIKDLEKHRIMSSDEFTIKVLKDLLGE